MKKEKKIIVLLSRLFIVLAIIILLLRFVVIHSVIGSSSFGIIAFFTILGTSFVSSIYALAKKMQDLRIFSLSSFIGSLITLVILVTLSNSYETFSVKMITASNVILDVVYGVFILGLGLFYNWKD